MRTFSVLESMCILSYIHTSDNLSVDMLDLDDEYESGTPVNNGNSTGRNTGLITGNLSGRR
jgi:hypothetical protein